MKRFAICLLGVFVFLLGVQWALASAFYRGAPLSGGIGPVFVPVGFFLAVVLTVSAAVWSAGTLGRWRRVAATAVGCVIALLAWTALMLGSVRLLNSRFAAPWWMDIFALSQQWLVQWLIVAVIVVCSGYIAALIVRLVRPLSPQGEASPSRSASS